jgi:hypothetical protein
MSLPRGEGLAAPFALIDGLGGHELYLWGGRERCKGRVGERLGGLVECL